MRCIVNVTVYLIAGIVLLSCGGDDSEPVVDDSGACREFNLNITPQISPVYYCGSSGQITNLAMSKLNNFWGSNVQACSYPGINNGYVFSYDPARIYYDPNLLSSWDLYYNTTFPGDIFLAHEYGHVVQNYLMLSNPYKELQADCLAGYYMGNQSCEGNISESDLMATYSHFCNIGNTAGATVWWDTSTHGTCLQRMSNVQKGFDGYRDGLLPGQACP